MNKKKTTLTREQRLRVYREALRTFTIMAGQKKYAKDVTGMCDHINRACKKFKYNWTNGYDIFATSRKSFPEYHSFKPRTMWVDGGFPTRYWWSTKTPRGRDRRLAVLTALANGESNER